MGRLQCMVIPVAAVLCMAAGARAADEYKIQMSRPCKVGETYHFQVHCAMKNTTMIDAGNGAAPGDSQAYDAQMDAVATVEAISTDGAQPTKMSVKITKCTNDNADLVPAGSVLEVDATGGDPKFTIDGKDLADPKSVAIFQQLIPIHRAKDVTDDVLMGTDKPQKVGDSWPVNAAELAKKMSSGPFQVDAGDLKGTVTLADVSQKGGVPTENFKVAVTGAIDKKAMDGGAELRNMKLSMTGDESLPVDVSGHGITESVDTNMTFTVVTGGVTVDAKMEQHNAGTIDLVTK